VPRSTDVEVRGDDDGEPALRRRELDSLSYACPVSNKRWACRSRWRMVSVKWTAPRTASSSLSELMLLELYDRRLEAP